MKKIVFPRDKFVALVKAEVKARGYNEEEATAAAEHLLWCALVQEWSRTLHKFEVMDNTSGSKVGGWVPGAKMELLYPTRSGTTRPRRVYDAHGQLGLLTAKIAVEEAIALCEEHGIGQVDVIGAGHLMCAGHWASMIAEAGLIGHVSCTSGTAEAAPHGGKKRTIGPDPFASAWPTKNALGFNVMIDTSATAYSMGKVSATKLDGKKLPPGVAITDDGQPTTEPVTPLILTFGESPTTSHKLFGLGLGIELTAALAGGSLPTLRGHRGSGPDEEQYRSHFRIQAEEPVGNLAARFAMGRTMDQNVAAVYHDIMDPNPGSHPPGLGKQRGWDQSEKFGGILMSQAQLDEHLVYAKRYGIDIGDLKEVEV